MGKAIIVPNVNWETKNFGQVTPSTLVISGNDQISGNIATTYTALLNGIPVEASWSASGGVLSSVTGTSVQLTPSNIPSEVTIVATYNGLIAQKTIIVTGLSSIDGKGWLDERNEVLLAKDNQGNIISAATWSISAAEDAAGNTLAITGGTTCPLASINANTGELTPATDSGAVGGTITVSASFGGVTANKTIKVYVLAGLAFHLDGADASINNNKWTDRKAGIEFTLSGCTKNNDNTGIVTRTDGTSRAVSQSTTTFNHNNGGTVEFAVKPMLAGRSHSILYPYGGTTVKKAQVQYSITQGKLRAFMGCNQALQASNFNTKAVNQIATVQSVSLGGLNIECGTVLTYDQSSNATNPNNDKWVLGAAVAEIGQTANDAAFVGEIYQIRIYTINLTQAQILCNQNIDKERYNIIFNS